MGGSVSNEYIMQLMDATPTAANVEEYARLTRENAVARGIRDLAGRCLERLDQQARPQDILEETARTLEQLEQQGTERELIGPQEGMLRFFQHREAVDRGEGKGFVPTGYRDLDDVLGGGMLASGMYVAMVTTVGGLIVGIPAYFGYNYLVARIEKLVFQMEANSIAFMDILNQPVQK